MTVQRNLVNIYQSKKYLENNS